MIEKEKLEEAKRLYKMANDDQRYVLERLFPELKESDDELTWLTNYIQEEAYSLSMDIRDNEDRVKLKKLQRSLAWLEKQTPVKFNDEKDEKIRKELLESFKYQQRESHTDKEWLNGIKLSEVVAWLEKQGEKPNNIKSLFKAGDCITNGEYTWFISDVCFNMYILLPLDGNVKVEDTISYVDKHFRLWSINDAKDGDILWHSNSASNGIFIFKEIRHTDGKVLCYCDYDSEDHFCTGEYHTCCWSSDNIKPATKEQRDHLFEKMKEAGYEWDAEKKELRKIEQMPKWSKKIRKNKIKKWRNKL